MANCHCGKPLHYANPVVQGMVERMVAELGETVTVQMDGRKWKVPRHFIALHGLKGYEIHRLGFQEVKDNG